VILFALPLLSSLFSSSGFIPSASVPAFHIDTPLPPLTFQRLSGRLKVPYFVNPVDVEEYGTSNRKWRDLDYAAENKLVGMLNVECDREIRQREQLLKDAQGWFLVDQAKLEEARGLEMRACRRLNALGLGR